MQKFVNAEDISRLFNCVVKVDDEYVYFTGLASNDSDTIMHGLVVGTSKKVLVDYTADNVVAGPFTLGYCMDRRGWAKFLTKSTGRHYGFGLSSSNVRSMSEDGLYEAIGSELLRTQGFKDMLDNVLVNTITSARNTVKSTLASGSLAIMTVALNRDFALSGSMNEEAYTLYHQGWAVAKVSPDSDDVLWSAAGDTSIIMKKLDRALSTSTFKNGGNGT